MYQLAKDLSINIDTHDKNKVEAGDLQLYITTTCFLSDTEIFLM